MGCNSDYMEATGKEKAFSQVACLIDELDGKPLNRRHWSGYHPRVYPNASGGEALVVALCSRLQTVDVSTCSLEMQVWWRDHQAADKARLEAELVAEGEKIDKAAALSKLSHYERELLGV